MQTSESITELVKALKKAQSEFEPVTKTTTNTQFHTKYATLDDMLASVLPVLNANDLFVIQPIETTEQGTFLETRLYHVSGECMSSKMLIPQFEQKGASVMQTLGIGISYLRRYMLSSLLGISTEDDSDGNAPAKKETPQRPQPKATTEQKTKIAQAIKDLGLADVDKALKDAHFPNLDNLTESQAQSAIERLEKAVKAKKEVDKKDKDNATS